MKYSDYNELERRIIDKIAVIGAIINEGNTASMFLETLHHELENRKGEMCIDVYELGNSCYTQAMQTLYG